MNIRLTTQTTTDAGATRSKSAVRMRTSDARDARVTKYYIENSQLSGRPYWRASASQSTDGGSKGAGGGRTSRLDRRSVASTRIGGACDGAAASFTASVCSSTAVCRFCMVCSVAMASSSASNDLIWWHNTSTPIPVFACRCRSSRSASCCCTRSVCCSEIWWRSLWMRSSASAKACFSLLSATCIFVGRCDARRRRRGSVRDIVAAAALIQKQRPHAVSGALANITAQNGARGWVGGSWFCSRC